MRASVALACTALPLALLAAVAAPTSGPTKPSSPIEPSSSPRVREIARIRAHFDSVLAELPRRDISRLGGAQRARRAELLATLRTYRDRGEFPHNYDFPGRAVPYFVDRMTGTACAVGHLLASSGRRDIVDRVAAASNNVYVAQLATDSAFTSWLDAHGLTLAEAAWIQVPYVEDPVPAPTPDVRGGSYAAGSAVALGAAAVAALWNARLNPTGSSRVGSILGVTAGVAALGMGGATLGQDGSTSLGVATIVAGAASTWLSTRGILTHRRLAAEQRNQPQRIEVAPIIPIDGNAAAGLSVTLRF
jgi:hypothetical protein